LDITYTADSHVFVEIYDVLCMLLLIFVVTRCSVFNITKI